MCLPKSGSYFWLPFLLFSVRGYGIIQGEEISAGGNVRIEKHSVLNFERGEKISFFFNGQEVEAYPTETIAAALHAAGVRKLGISPELHRPRGLFCAIGNCSSCFMVVDGEPNMRVCVMKVKSGMRVEEQVGKGDIQFSNKK